MSLRSRFALACAGVFLAVGTLVVAALYFLVRSNLQYRADFVTPRWFQVNGRAVPRFDSGYEYARAVAMQVHDLYRQATLNSVINVGALIVLVASLGAFGLGWAAAGWVVRPVRSVTATARRVAQSHDLGERIDYRGSGDELGELAGIFDTMLERLGRSFDGQRRFVANASHELRTPLTINRTLVDVAVRRPDATDDVRRLGESLLLVNARHERLIDGLLALVEGERAGLDRRPFDLCDVAEHVLDQAAAEAEAGEVMIHSLLDPAPTAGEAVLVERLVQNLVENAIRHNHPKGEVWVTTRHRMDRVEVIVANTGLPVPPYEIETIFEPFRRLHGDRLRSDRGSGLGLSIVRVIAEGHGGTVTAVPRPEGGLTVTVELPAVDPPM
ncbi:HAMP domain-containing sensor histidine kinase [Spongiactinospora sp. TRM90649]|uniref:sensor histidine kinase n=1 Tax=Spongiactinospora sp. TRM90649 TaxID=3031114 RepID=UPI0023F7BB6B|nr:HAMP domain-containing sensor histidine kinase [Spongiactinospora sp. TRM90649]MDF5752850.1 HAMP domain-containing sensor histidine kinase [Spongiactinospora sp. TRM90649]